MSINRMLTAEPVKKSVNLRGGVRAVYDADRVPFVLCGQTAAVRPERQTDSEIPQKRNGQL